MRTRMLAVGLTTALGTSGSVLGIMAMTANESSAPGATVEGLIVGGIPAGGLDRAALTAVISDAVSRQPERVHVRVGAQRATLDTRQLGFSVDVAATVDHALQIRRSTAASESVRPVLTIDDARLADTVSDLVARASLPVKEADLRYLRGALRAMAPVAGQRGEPGRIRAALLDVTHRLPWPATLTVPIRSVTPDTTIEDLAGPLQRARALLAHPPVLIAGARRVAVRPSLLGPALTVITRRSPAGSHLELGIRSSQLPRLGTRLAKALSLEPTEPQLETATPAIELTAQGTTSWRPRKAEVRLVAPGKTGEQADRAEVMTALSRLLPVGAPGLARVPTVTTLPASSDLAARQLDAALGTFTTSFACCQPRVRNIARIAESVDGTLIAPGGSFSLNGIVGPRTRAKGYVEAPFILNGELSTDVGGGVSQFATTTLNAAYFAGLRLERHSAHSFWISRYPPGREATVHYPSIDLRWRNTTSTPVLIRAKVRSTSLTVTVYGKDDGRVVRSRTGPREPVSGKAFRVTVTRVTTIPGRPVATESWTTTYNNPPVEE